MNASLLDIKKEIIHYNAKQLAEICLKLAKFKKENKQFLSFLLFNSNDLQGYIQDVKNIIDEEFLRIESNYFYPSSKTVKKIIKIVNLYLKFCDDKKVQIELNIYLCKKMIDRKLLYRSNAVDNMYIAILKKINKTLEGLHSDYQLDYKEELLQLNNIFQN